MANKWMFLGALLVTACSTTSTSTSREDKEEALAAAAAQKAVNLRKEFRNLETAQALCPQYAGKSTTECFLDYVKTENQQATAMDMTLLMQVLPNVAVDESQNDPSAYKRYTTAINLYKGVELAGQWAQGVIKKNPDALTQLKQTGDAHFQRKPTSTAALNNFFNTGYAIAFLRKISITQTGEVKTSIQKSKELTKKQKNELFKELAQVESKFADHQRYLASLAIPTTANK